MSCPSNASSYFTGEFYNPSGSRAILNYATHHKHAIKGAGILPFAVTHEQVALVENQHSTTSAASRSPTTGKGECSTKRGRGKRQKDGSEAGSGFTGPVGEWNRGLRCRGKEGGKLSGAAGTLPGPGALT